MTAETSIRRSPLQDRTDELAAVSAGGAVTLAEAPLASMTNLRIRPGAEQLAEPVLGCALPGALRATSSAAGVSVLWLGPDEFLVVDPGGRVAAQLADAIGSEAGSVVDVSANRTTISLTGPRVRDVLDKGIAIDLHPSVTAPTGDQTWCVQTLLTSVPIILWNTGGETEAEAETEAETEEWRLLVRPSFANYVADWLIDATTEYR